MSKFRRQLMAASISEPVPPTPPLPYDAEVEYLEASGAQYIDSGINADSDLAIFFKFALTSTEINQNMGVLKVDGSTYTRHHFSVAGSTTKIYYWLNTSQFLNKNVDTNAHTLGYNGTTRKVLYDGTSYNAPSGSWDTELNYWIFARNSNGAAITYTKMKIYFFQMNKNGSQVRDFIPVRKDGVGYLYDKVSGQLFGNLGSGSFTYGNDVS